MEHHIEEVVIIDKYMQCAVEEDEEEEVEDADVVQVPDVDGELKIIKIIIVEEQEVVVMVEVIVAEVVEVKDVDVETIHDGEIKITNLIQTINPKT